jgi:hypothetical protein
LLWTWENNFGPLRTDHNKMMEAGISIHGWTEEQGPVSGNRTNERVRPIICNTGGNWGVRFREYPNTSLGQRVGTNSIGHL